MSSRKTAGIALMVAFAGAFIAWSMLAPPAIEKLRFVHEVIAAAGTQRA